MKHKNYNVLIVEQDKVFGELLEEYLSMNGLDATLVGSAEDAINVLEDKVFTVVICNVQLPKISGLTLLKMIKCRTPFITVIMVSSKPSNEIALNSIEFRAYDCLFKPFRLNIILNVLKEIEHRWNRWQQFNLLAAQRSL